MPQRILVIDDSPFIFKAVKKALEPAGYEMIGQAFDGKQGLDMVEEHKPDIIVLDVTMPVMDGLETAKNLHEQKSTASVIMLSAMGDDELISTAKSYGVKHFLTKPFKPEEMLEAISNLL